MALKNFNPVTPSLRGTILIDRSELFKGQVALDETGYVLVEGSSTRTDLPGVFASGDVVTGAKTVVDAVHVSKMIAEEMDQYMQAHKDEVNA